MRLERTEQERDEMRKKIEKLMKSGKSYETENQLRDIPKGFNNNTNVNLNVNSNFFDTSNIKSDKYGGLYGEISNEKPTGRKKSENSLINQINDSNNNLTGISKPQQPVKPSALVRK